MRPAGVLIPAGVGETLIAGFGQIEAQVIKPGMVAKSLAFPNRSPSYLW